MAIYFYKARDIKGKLLQGTIEATAIAQGVQKLQQLGLYVVDIQRKNKILNLFKGTRLNLKDLALICKQLANLQEAGVPLLMGLQIIYDYQEKPKIKGLVKSLMNEMELGFSFSEACANYSSNIPPLMANMIYAGESGGFLEETLNKLAITFEKEWDLKEKIITAISYSVIVLIISIFFIFFLFSVIVPMFLEAFKDMGVSLSRDTEVLLKIGFMLTNNWYYLLLMFLIIYGLIIFTGTTRKGKEFRDKLILKVPVVGVIIKKTLISRFCRELANLLTSGINVSKALETLEKTSSNLVLKSEIRDAHNNLKLGLSLSESFKESNLMPKIVIQMIAVGEQSGNLEKLLFKTSDYFEQDVNQLIERLPKLIEPIILVIVGIVVGVIIIGFFLPMLNTMYQLEI